MYQVHLHFHPWSTPVLPDCDDKNNPFIDEDDLLSEDDDDLEEQAAEMKSHHLKPMFTLSSKAVKVLMAMTS